jgi:hypothetical protein
MALTQTDLDALDAAIATSELEVEIDGRRVRYRKTSELLEARQHVAGVLKSASGTRRTGGYRFNFTTSRGG